MVFSISISILTSRRSRISSSWISSSTLLEDDETSCIRFDASLKSFSGVTLPLHPDRNITVPAAETAADRNSLFLKSVIFTPDLQDSR